MAIVVSVLIVAFCLYLVISPLLGKKEATGPVKMVDDTEDISIQNVYATLNELEMDFYMKKLSEEDYNKLKAQYERLAAELLEKEKTSTKKKGSNQDQAAKDIEAEIEEELAKLRKERGE